MKVLLALTMLFACSKCILDPQTGARLIPKLLCIPQGDSQQSLLPSPVPQASFLHITYKKITFSGHSRCVHSSREAPTHVHTGTRGKHRRKPDCPRMLLGMGHLEGFSGPVQATLSRRANAGPGITPGLCSTP